MASLDFDVEKAAFRTYYDETAALMEVAKSSFITLLRSLLSGGEYAAATVTGRLKNREECIRKFNRKYREELEKSRTDYEIKDHITDLIGLRLICLYEDDVEPIAAIIREQFHVIDVTDKIAKIEGTENEFGYKGLHLDLRLGTARASMPEYVRFASFRFELQIRTIVQDSWSALDHKIKYKKSIPADLKRRINTLAALFELADREFRQVRDATNAAIEKAQGEELETDGTTQIEQEVIDGQDNASKQHASLDTFRLLRIARHFFPNFHFEPHKVDGFTTEVINREPGITRGDFNFYLRETIGTVRQYRDYFVTKGFGDTFNPYTEMRHCLYAANQEAFSDMLVNIDRMRFDEWRAEVLSAEKQASRPRRARGRPVAHE
ncbi:GTP pyrophosphokinase YwaC [Komagataeibacter saccharivorans]|uniref:GTP pyrophosphokinase YwaC n=1 Tax=Komagataeibacter saccharivorans TaxID=265959 RepID=A0A347WC17_9PROT|nr:(p)ppGpp synthetase [Komagataeibacter saccharivorans]AXY22410.1 GTP pyrophosphokinase YwaC [Komagataeibacter saccharivorans]